VNSHPTAAHGFLADLPSRNTEYLARQIIAAAGAGQSTSKLVTQLLTQQNPSDGGFGDFPGYQSTVLDTAFALQALAVAGARDTTVSAPAVGYLLNHQATGGGWADGANAPSVYVSALAMRALWHYRTVFNVTAALDKAQVFLLNQRISDRWASAFETASALIAILPRLASLDTLTPSITALAAQQTADGSWAGDVFSTALALRALALSQNTVPNPDLSAIYGQVVDGNTNQPLPHITLRLDGLEDYSALTNGQGQFALNAIQPGSYDLSIHEPGYGQITGNISLTSQQTLAIGTLTLFPDRQSFFATIRGLVTDVDNGNPLINVAITAHGKTTVTNSKGEYELQQVPPGALSVSASLAGYAPVRASAEVVAGGTVIFSPQLVGLSGEQTALEGYVTDSVTGLPLPAVNIRLSGFNNASQQTDDTGFYRFAGLLTGSTVLEATLSGYQPSQGRIDIAPNKTYHVAFELTPVEQSSSTLQGVIANGVSGEALPGALITLSGANRGMQTSDREGKYTFTGLSPGSTTVDVVISGYQPATHLLTLPSDKTIVYSPTLIPEDQVADTTQVTGQVIDAVTGDPLADTTVSVVAGEAGEGGFEATFLTDELGYFSISQVPGPSATLNFNKPRYDIQLLSLTLQGQTQLEIGVVALRPLEQLVAIPDLIAESMDTSQLTHDPNTFVSQGILTATVRNVGNGPLTTPFTVLAYHNSNSVLGYQAEGDVLLAQADHAESLAVGSSTDVSLTIDKKLPFRDAPIEVWVDSTQAIIELDETNNERSTAASCGGQRSSIDLAICMDASGSVGYANFKLQLDGLAQAIENPLIIPRDGTVRLSLLTGSGSVEIPPTVIDTQSMNGLVENIRGQRANSGSSALSSCVRSAADQIVVARPVSSFRAVTVSGDGYWYGESLALSAASYAVDQGVDVIDAIGVGNVSLATLNASVYPQPAGGEEGVVTLINSSSQFAEAIAQTARRQTSIPDLTLGNLQIIDNGINQPLSFQVRVGNAGNASIAIGQTISLYEGAPANSLKLLATTTLAEALAPGAYQDVLFAHIATTATEFFAKADPDDVLSECRETNNTATVDTLNPPVLGSLSVTPSAQSYGPHSPTLFSAAITNTGSFASDYRVVLQIVDASGALVTQFDPLAVNALSAGDSLALSQAWNTGVILAGDYTLQGTLYAPDDSILDKAEALFTIGGGGTPTVPTASLRTSTDRAVYHTTDTVQISNLVRNTTPNVLIPNAQVKIQATEPNGQPLFNNTLSLGDLAPGGQRELTTPLTLQGSPEGEYTVSGTLRDASGTVLATDQTTFTVQDSVELALRGTVTALYPERERGEGQVCTDELRHTGAKPLPNQPIRQLVVRMDNDTPLKSTEQTLDLAPGTIQTLIRSIQTTGFEAGDYACVLQAHIAGQWQTLDAAVFSVTEPPVVLDGQLSLGERGSVLILLDDPSHHQGHDPHGPNAAPPLAAQRSYLETLLTEAGWSYTITTAADTFTNEFRSGDYQTYLILSEHIKLPKQVQAELREAVFRGEGLIVAGDHDQRNGYLDEPLGIKYKGKTGKPNRLRLITSALHPASETKLLTGDKVQRAELQDARVAGYFAAANDGYPSPGKDMVAVTTHDYGFGRSVYAGFDVLSEATVARSPVFAELLLNALTTVYPIEPQPLTGAVIPLHLDVSNRGMATPVVVTLTAIPTDTVVVDALASRGEIESLAADQQRWVFQLPESTAATLTTWWQLPEFGGPVAFDALVQSGSHPNLVDHDTLSLTVDVQVRPSLSDAQAELMRLAATDRAFDKALKKLNKAAYTLAKGKVEYALKELLKVTEELAKLAHPEAAEARRLVAQALATVARQTLEGGPTAQH
jgi:hypothetical protein